MLPKLVVVYNSICHKAGNDSSFYKQNENWLNFTSNFALSPGWTGLEEKIEKKILEQQTPRLLTTEVISCKACGVWSLKCL